MFNQAARCHHEVCIELVVAGVLVDGAKVLLRRHPKLGKWLPPGGHIQPGETPDAALRRELHEETGLIVEPVDYAHLSPAKEIKRELAIPFYVNVHSVGDHDHCCFFYRCRAIDYTKGAPEVVDLCWFDIDAIDVADIPEDVKHLVKLAARRI